MGWFLSLLSFWMSLRVTPKRIVAYLESQGHSSRALPEFIPPEAVNVACVQVRVRGYRDLKDYLGGLAELTRKAAEGGADVVVFPEYIGLLTGTLLPFFDRLLYWAMDGRIPEGLDTVEVSQAKVGLLAEAFQNYISEVYLYAFGTLARLWKVTIVAGSCLFYEEGRLYNRSVVFGPDGSPLGAQDKTTSFGFDGAVGVKPGKRIEVIETLAGPLSVVLGSDAYYFENFQIAAAKGAKLIAVPDSRGGILRDLLRCRANEAGVYLLYSNLCNPKAQNARAGVLAPMAVTPAHSGILAAVDNARRTGIACVRLDLGRLSRVYPESEPNPAFLAEDYLHSYVYCGNFVMPEPEPPPKPKSLMEKQLAAAQRQHEVPEVILK